jgi:hypothetical protein
MNENDPFKLGELRSITVGTSAGAVDQFRVALEREMSTQIGKAGSIPTTQSADSSSPLAGVRNFAQNMMENERSAISSLREMPQRFDAILRGTASQSTGPRDLTYVNGQLVATERSSSERREAPVVDDPNEVEENGTTDINSLLIKSMKEVQERTVLINREERKFIETSSQMNITQNLGFGILRGTSGLLTSFLRPS